MLDLLFHNVKSIHFINNVDIGIEGGIITYIKDTGSPMPPAKHVVEADGRVVLPGFNESHIHLEKAYLLQKMEKEATSLQEAIQITADLKKTFTKEDITERATRVLGKCIQSGVTNLRCHVEVDDILQLKAMESILELKEKFANLITLQIVTFPQEGIFIQQHAAELMEESLKMGADAVGGIPYNDRDSSEHLDYVFHLAERYNKPIDLHIDLSDDPDDLSILDIIDRTKKYHMEGKVSVAHMTSLGSVEHHKARKIAAKIADAGINVMALPATDLYLNGRGDFEKIRRGLTPVSILLEERANVIFATNNIQNPFTPFGTGNILDVAYLFAEVTRMGTKEDANTIIDMLTYRSAKALNLTSYGFKIGGTADLVMFDAKNLRDVLLTQPHVVCSYKNGRKVI
ncbi:amidohydrolase family protein [Sporolactobacillus sp. Y61]|uniref:Amidohydrolase family protein n=1 Tax=Sporolactobacillus sp. Y61 TaxID=3160863 RepID=A0AAU8IIE9_9BACL